MGLGFVNEDSYCFWMVFDVLELFSSTTVHDASKLISSSHSEKRRRGGKKVRTVWLSLKGPY